MHRTRVRGAAPAWASANTTGRRALRTLVCLALALGIAGACTGGPTGSSGSPATTAPFGSSTQSATTAPASTTPVLSATPTSTPGPTPTPSPAPPLALASSAFPNGGAIPARYSCSGADGSPPLAWSHLPHGTVAFALVVVDTDASNFVHWVLSDIPGDLSALAAGQRAGVAGRNSNGGIGYYGPCPPVGSGVHHYVFTLYALSHKLGLGGVPTAAQVRAAAAKVTLATARLTATYLR
jgi:Raf kinase inhibitor-like YbhB/YbcL family protein